MLPTTTATSIAALNAPATFALATLLLVSCTTGAEVSGRRTISVTRLDTLVPPGDSLAHSPTEIFSAGERLGLVNAGSEILLYSMNGVLENRLGGTGSGPGELRMARAASAFGDKLLVLNHGNNRIETFSLLTGEAIARPAPSEALYGPVVFRDTTSLLVGTGGRNRSAVLEISSGGSVLRRFGIGREDVPEFNMAEMKANIRDGIVPLLMRAVALPIPAPNRGAAILWTGTGVVQHFDSTGTMTWALTLDTLPISRLILTDFFDRNATIQASDRVAMLSYFSAGRYREEALWILMRSPDSTGTHLLELSADGRIKTVVTAPLNSVRGFDFTVDERQILLLDHGTGAVLRAHLP